MLVQIIGERCRPTSCATADEQRPRPLQEFAVRHLVHPTCNSLLHPLSRSQGELRPKLNTLALTRCSILSHFQIREACILSSCCCRLRTCRRVSCNFSRRAPCSFSRWVSLGFLVSRSCSRSCRSSRCILKTLALSCHLDSSKASASSRGSLCSTCKMLFSSWALTQLT